MAASWPAKRLKRHELLAMSREAALSALYEAEREVREIHERQLHADLAWCRRRLHRINQLRDIVRQKS